MSNVKIYKGIICLEIASEKGPLWWPQGGRLHYTPIKIQDIKQLVQGTVSGEGRAVWAVPLEVRGKPSLVAINLPRSDIWGLKAVRLLPSDLVLPATSPTYEPWPGYALWNPNLV